jgi:hypothetical protein
LGNGTANWGNAGVTQYKALGDDAYKVLEDRSSFIRKDCKAVPESCAVPRRVRQHHRSGSLSSCLSEPFESAKCSPSSERRVTGLSIFLAVVACGIAIFISLPILQAEYRHMTFVVSVGIGIAMFHRIDIISETTAQMTSAKMFIRFVILITACTDETPVDRIACNYRCYEEVTV